MSLASRLTAVVVSGVLVATAGSALTAPPAAGLPDYRTRPTHFTNPRALSPQVVDLRWSEHPRFDRVVIDVNGRRPGFDAQYVRRLVRDGSGAVVHLRGRHKFMIALHPARAHDDTGTNVYRGPRHVRVDLPTLRGIAFLGDFEGTVSFGFGVRTRPYRAFTMTHPSRIVLDWRHGG